jgi:hypothetical protein
MILYALALRAMCARSEVTEIVQLGTITREKGMPVEMCFAETKGVRVGGCREHSNNYCNSSLSNLPDTEAAEDEKQATPLLEQQKGGAFPLPR